MVVFHYRDLMAIITLTCSDRLEMHIVAKWQNYVFGCCFCYKIREFKDQYFYLNHITLLSCE